MPNSIVIAGDMANIVIEISGYENPKAPDSSDANWLSCTVVLRIGPFSGSIAASFTTQDFARFFNEIGTALHTFSGVASFLTDEDTLRLILKFEKTGRVHISGVAQDLGPPKASLTFSFESDQSFLTQTCRQLEKVTHNFPIKGL
jgi:hypothetical protein